MLDRSHLQVVRRTLTFCWAMPNPGRRRYRRNTAVAMIAMIYSIFAIFASGKDAVLGGMIVMGVGFMIYGFIALRFAAVKPIALKVVRAA